LKEGDFFGDPALTNEMNENSYKNNVKALTDICCLSLGSQDIMKILGDSIVKLQLKNILKLALN